MKAVLCLFLCLVLLLPGGALAAEPQHEFLVLLSFGGTQSGGDEAAFIDAQGGVYYIDMAAENLYWHAEDTLTMLRALPDKYKVGELSADDLAEVNRLIDGIQTVKPVDYLMAACDAGIFTQEVYRKAADGSTEEILLMQAGDSIRENMDENAILLSSQLLDLFSFTNHLRRWSHLFPYGDSVPLSLSYERGSFFGGSRAYTLRRSGDSVHFSATGSNGDETDVTAELRGFEAFDLYTGILGDLQRLIDKQGLAAWDGFDQTDDQILDGDGFSLTIRYGSGSISAKGYERYPDGYKQAASALEGFLGNLILLAQMQE